MSFYIYCIHILLGQEFIQEHLIKYMTFFVFLFSLSFFSLHIDIATLFPSLWLRYIPAFLDTLKQSKIIHATSAQNRKKKSSDHDSMRAKEEGLMPSESSSGGGGRKQNTLKDSKFVDATFRENMTGKFVAAKVSFRFHGDGKKLFIFLSFFYLFFCTSTTHLF